ncbi:MAG: hypothetical protein LBS65_01455 [Desulfovibrio sp.]|nr:hypothetical protein [Desulfovibrio sp.]
MQILAGRSIPIRHPNSLSIESKPASSVECPAGRRKRMENIKKAAGTVMPMRLALGHGRAIRPEGRGLKP